METETGDDDEEEEEKEEGCPYEDCSDHVEGLQDTQSEKRRV